MIHKDLGNQKLKRKVEFDFYNQILRFYLRMINEIMGIIDVADKDYTVPQNGIVFVGDGYSKMIYHQQPCKIIEKNHCIIIEPLQRKKNFYDLFKESINNKKVLESELKSKLVFILSASIFFENRGSGFTDWLKLLKSNIGINDVIDCSSCLIVESMSYNVNQIINKIKSFLEQETVEGSQILLKNWIQQNKILVQRLNNYDQSEIGIYQKGYQKNSEKFRSQLDMILNNCNLVSKLKCKAMLPISTNYEQKECYKQLNKLYTQQFTVFGIKLLEKLNFKLDNDAQTMEFYQFEKSYAKTMKMLMNNENNKDETDYLMHKISDQFADTKELKTIANQFSEQYKKGKYLTELMTVFADQYNPESYKLQFYKCLGDTQQQITKLWNQKIQNAKKIVQICDSLRLRFAKDSQFNHKLKELTFKLKLENSKVTEEDANKLLNLNLEKIKKINQFIEFNRIMVSSVLRTVEYGNDKIPLYGCFFNAMLLKKENLHLNIKIIFIQDAVSYTNNLFFKKYEQYEKQLSHLQQVYAVSGYSKDNGYSKCQIFQKIVFSLLFFIACIVLIIVVDYLFIIALCLVGFIALWKIDQKYGFSLSFYLRQIQLVYEKLPKELREQWIDFRGSKRIQIYLKNKEQQFQQKSLLKKKD